MKYIAKKFGKRFEISGIKEMKTLDGSLVEVIIDTKMYEKSKLEELISSYTLEKEEIIKKYDADLKDMQDILTAINQGK
jgi:hypothetical protein